MRLAKLAVASVSPTVGAVRSNVDRLIAVAKEMADANVTIGAFPEQAIGGYPPEDLVQWPGFLIGQRRELERFAKETSERRTVFVIGLAVSVGGQIFNAAAVVHRGRIVGLVPKEKLPTYNVFYEGRTFSRGGAGLALDAGGVPLGDYRFHFDFGDVAVEVCEDAWSPGRPDAPPLLLGRGDRRQRLGLAVPHGRRFDAPRDARHARGRQPGAAALRQRRRRAGRPDLRRRRLHLPERPPGVRGAALRRRLVVLGRRSRSHAPAAHGEHHLAHRTAKTSGCSGEIVPAIAVDGATADRSSLTYPAPDGGNFFLPAAGRADASTRAIARSTTCSRRSRSAWRLLREDRRVQVARHRALRRPRLDADAAGRVARSAADQRAAPAIAAFYMPSRTRRRRHASRPRTVLAENSASRCRPSRSTTRSSARSRRPSQMLRRRAAHRADAAEHPGAHSRPADVELGELVRRAVPADRQHEREGGRLHHHRRRPEGALAVIANVPKTVVITCSTTSRRRFGFKGIVGDAAHRARARSSPTTRWPRTS